MISRSRHAGVFCALAAVACPASLAATTPPDPAKPSVYQCGGQYQQSPCDGGRAVAVPPGPSVEQREQAKAVAAAEQSRADALRKERLAREAEEAKRLAAQRKAAEKVSAKAAAQAKPVPKPDCAHHHKRASGQGKQDAVNPVCEKETYRGSPAAGVSPSAAKQPAPTPAAAKLK
jgi:hypothetical protein